jgi:hypothetical protein
MRRILLTTILILILVSCKKEKSINFHFDYYPIVENQFVTYKVDEVITDDTVNQHDTLSYFMKVQIGAIEIDNEGRTVNRVNRYVGPSATGPWTLQDIWTTLIDGDKAELIEENNRIIKMIFSPTKTKEWDANAFTNLDPLDCYYDEIHKEKIINGFTFDSTVTVEQEDELNFIQYKRKFEVYAKGIGMVRKHYKDFEIMNNDSTNVKKGKELRMIVVDFSN